MTSQVEDDAIGRPGHVTLATLVADKARFLADPGCEIDFDAIAAELAIPHGDEDDPAGWASAWFDHMAAILSVPVLTLHRHQTVADVDAYVAALGSGEASAGVHWSLHPDTRSPAPEQAAREILMRGRIDPSQVDWVTTFQSALSHPWEGQVWFEGPIAIDLVTELETGRELRPQGGPHPIL